MDVTIASNCGVRYYYSVGMYNWHEEHHQHVHHDDVIGMGPHEDMMPQACQSGWVEKTFLSNYAFPHYSSLKSYKWFGKMKISITIFIFISISTLNMDQWSWSILGGQLHLSIHTYVFPHFAYSFGIAHIIIKKFNIKTVKKVT